MKIIDKEIMCEETMYAVELEYEGEYYAVSATVTEDHNTGYKDIDLSAVMRSDDSTEVELNEEATKFIKKNLES